MGSSPLLLTWLPMMSDRRLCREETLNGRTRVWLEDGRSLEVVSRIVVTRGASLRSILHIADCISVMV